MGECEPDFVARWVEFEGLEVVLLEEELDVFET